MPTVEEEQTIDRIWQSFEHGAGELTTSMKNMTDAVVTELHKKGCTIKLQYGGADPERRMAIIKLE
jgi:hypothetical protein